ncbi:hypothetical protein L484_002985 [Morus notabilis]|uniref:Uncharacterized protein n=1 Tax=Morus notabilis TaxID=981085 RepID=W9QK06_9ROSA|nr:hypothetical protein L484_002985 [Morus notabilis]
MEAIALSVSTRNENDNKENVVPFSQKHNKQVLLSSAQSSKKIVKKRRIERKPLADITHLFNFSAQSCNSLFFPSISLSIHVSDSRTRNSLMGVSETSKVASSKSLRMGFR